MVLTNKMTLTIDDREPIQIQSVGISGDNVVVRTPRPDGVAMTVDSAVQYGPNGTSVTCNCPGYQAFAYGDKVRITKIPKEGD